MKLWQPETTIVPATAGILSLGALWPGWKMIKQGGLIGMERGHNRVWVEDMNRLFEPSVARVGLAMHQQYPSSIHHKLIPNQVAIVKNADGILTAGFVHSSGIEAHC